MLSKYGRKIFFVYPPESLKSNFLKEIFKDEYETYLLEDLNKLEKILNMFNDSIVFFNIDKGFESGEWIKYINTIHNKHESVAIGVISKNDDSYLKKEYLLEIGIKGGYIIIEDNTADSIKKINKVLEVNEARGRRKNIRCDFNNENSGKVLVKVYSEGGSCHTGLAKSFSAMGILVDLGHDSMEFISLGEVEKIVFTLEKHKFSVKGSLLKEVSEGEFFLNFKDISEDDRDFVQSFIFNSLQVSFNNLLKSL